ncbi:DNA-binding transcriptional regulator, MerR family [Clostridium cavendishii DSM 21758]|uniref:DNA-binding transcriptional regulator, MerR family n=1 Tax=Clostridium cavendishii DSM 21758 TaxID=1121302 RepID=A0A1M6HM65_9CLOT|nr:GyrI-like domain-containing protein [Clostridium cavendishii]SHJ23259.1 DNA-binding transcriptional regulator, MerR family [Clostridium cavendishii DSM 21758]
MKEYELYCIGSVEKMCNLSKKALRYYDKRGILCPDEVSDKSGYRYYSKKTLLSVPMIKYYKQSGFKLEEMKDLLSETSYSTFQKSFKNKIEELKEIENELNLKLKSIEDWYDLITEADMVIENNVQDVSVKYLDACKMVYLNQDFNYDYIESIVNIEFTNYIEHINNAITGPVIIEYPSFEEKINGKCNKMTIMQRTILKNKDFEEIEFGGFMVAACYHIGSYETINNTYKKIKDWANNNGYKCSEKSYERYVIDYWTTKDSNKFVTEVMIKISKRKK